ncbi:MAG: NYN domain-containing protein [Desulfobulbaceae bacterium]|nr:NYN domain-containing protein [Desulfobulbaceae bacterium]
MYKRCCVFVDGENFRHAITDLFNNFDKSDYLPKDAKWGDFFNWLVGEIACGCDECERVRTYWYVIEHIDCWPYRIPNVDREKDTASRLFKRNQDWADEIVSLNSDPEALLIKLREYSEILNHRKSRMLARARGWAEVQASIGINHSAIEFRREGAIRYNLFTQELGNEKAVDVKLAVDMIMLQEIYDIAIIVSGDQDYVPAVKHLKDSGKRIVNVSFSTRGGKLLPGGARRLNQVTDDRFVVTHEQLSGFLNISN